jgi:small conductance mechanosensitive channel
MILSELRVDVAALIATAGVAGLAIGFGAQTLVKDVISGIFLLFDNTIAIGDRVRIGTDYGIVEYIGVRLIKVRRFDGELMMVPAGELRVFGNTSIGFSRAVIDIGVAYKEDIDRVIEILTRLANEWMAANPEVLRAEVPDVLAIMGFADSAILAKVAISVAPGEQFRAEREMRLAIKKAFDEAGIEIPFPQRTVHLAGPTSDPDLLKAT